MTVASNDQTVRPGLFCLVDSECLMPQSTDSSLFSKILSNFRNSKVIYKASRFGNTDFGVAHYAGEVVYSVETFLMKNTDKLSKDVVSLFKNSEVELVRRLFTDPRFAPPESSPAARAGARSARRGSRQEERQRQNVTVSMMFREQLERLVEDLNKTNPRYVRCIKPNGNKRPNELDSLDVLRQLRCAGMLESIRIRRAGYAVRRPFKEFFARFRILAPHLVPGPDPDYRSLCQRLVLEVEDRLGEAAKQQKLWQLGQSRVFMKEDLERKMEQMIVESAKRQVQTIQRCWRGFVGRRYFVQVRKAAMTFQAAFRTLKQREVFLKQRHAAAQVQATLQTILAQDRFAVKTSAAIQVQAFLRTAAAMAALDSRRAMAAAAAAAAAAAEVAAAKAAAAAEAAEAATAAQPARPAPPTEDQLRRELFPENGKAPQAQAPLPPAALAPVQASSAAASPVSNDLELSRRDGNTWTSASSGLSLDASIRNAAMNLKGGNGALDSLRSELMARLEGPGSSGRAGVVDPSHPLSSSLRQVGDGTRQRDEKPQEVPTRATIVNQRAIMQQLQAEFAEAMTSKEEDIPMPSSDEATRAERQQLEEEVRRLRRENGLLKTSVLSSKEEAEARQIEAKDLLSQVSDLKSDLEDVRFGHRDEIKVFQRQIQELQDLSHSQGEELRRKTARLEEVEGRAANWESEAKEAMKAISSGKERLEELHKQEEKTRHKLEDTDVVFQESQSSWRAEQERLTEELQSKDREIAKLKEVLALHAPKEELQRWMSRCEDLQAQVEQANLANRKMQSAVGHMSNAACARGGDLQEMQRRNIDLANEYEKQKAELKRMDLEKRELKDQIENVEVSLKYFQGKYQETTKDLKLQKEQSDKYAQSLVSAQKLIRELQGEMQKLQRGVGDQQPTVPAANGRHGAYPVSQANLSRHPSIQEAPNEVEIGRQSLLTQLENGIFRS